MNIWQCSGTFRRGGYIQTVMFNNNWMGMNKSKYFWTNIYHWAQHPVAGSCTVFLSVTSHPLTTVSYSRGLIILCCFFPEARWASWHETRGKILPVFCSTNQLLLRLLPVLPRICSVTDCISGPLDPYASMRVGKHLCLGRLWHVTTPGKIWARPNNNVAVWQCSGNSRNCSFNAAGFQCMWLNIPMSLLPFLKWQSLLALRKNLPIVHMPVPMRTLQAEGTYSCPLWLSLFRWEFLCNSCWAD